jgi:NADH:ubiquinone oxidoreductase subunit 5 (subunit L)/multisubunit Na+/H+ antiporter MnhA subunit
MPVVLAVVVVLPLVAAGSIALNATTAYGAARLAVTASALVAAGAVSLLVAVALDGPVDALVVDREGRAVVGLSVERVGAVLVTLTAAVGLVVQAFASRSLGGDPRARRFHVLALVLTSATTIVAVSATASGVLVGWVVTGATLVALLGHRAPWPPAVDAQRQTRRAFWFGDAALAGAMIGAWLTVGDLDLRTLGSDVGELAAEKVAGTSASTVVALLLVVAGVARSALVPLHRWLPSTLAAPTPVSALLHAGVINGAGVLLIRFAPVFSTSSSAMGAAFVLGVVTAFGATAVMLVRTDVKGSLVWSTAGQMGFMVMQLGVGAFAAALFHIVGHAMFKAAMFLGAGGAISANARQATLPHLGRERSSQPATPVRLFVGVVVPLASFAFALALIDPHLSPAASILVVVFGALAVGRAANGWLTSAPFSPVRTIVTASLGVVVLVFAYVGGLTLFENFVVDVVPYDVPAAVGPMWVVATLVVVGATVIGVARMPGRRGDRIRRVVYAWLVSTGASTTVVPAAATVPETSRSTEPTPQLTLVGGRR